MKKNEHSKTKEDIIKSTNICIMEVPEGEDKGVE